MNSGTKWTQWWHQGEKKTVICGSRDDFRSMNNVEFREYSLSYACGLLSGKPKKFCLRLKDRVVLLTAALIPFSIEFFSPFFSLFERTRCRSSTEARSAMAKKKNAGFLLRVKDSFSDGWVCESLCLLSEVIGKLFFYQPDRAESETKISSTVTGLEATQIVAFDSKLAGRHSSDGVRTNNQRCSMHIDVQNREYLKFYESMIFDVAVSEEKRKVQQRMHRLRFWLRREIVNRPQMSLVRRVQLWPVLTGKFFNIQWWTVPSLKWECKH